jgi:hypothetical protein
MFWPICSTPLPKPPNTGNRQISVSSRRMQAVLLRIQPAFRNMGAVQIRMQQMRKTPLRSLRASSPPQQIPFVIVAAIVSLCSASSDGGSERIFLDFAVRVPKR